MRTPGLWASMRGIYALRSFGEAEGDSSCIRGLRLMGLFVRHALRAGRSGSPTLQPAHTRDRGRARLGATTSHTRGASRPVRGMRMANALRAFRGVRFAQPGGRRSHIGPPL